MLDEVFFCRTTTDRDTFVRVIPAREKMSSILKCLVYVICSILAFLNERIRAMPGEHQEWQDLHLLSFLIRERCDVRGFASSFVVVAARVQSGILL